jgi:hypothetical protein
MKGTTSVLINDYYQPLEDTHQPDLVLIDLPYEGSTRNGKEIFMPNSDVPLEEIIEQLIEKMTDDSRERMMIVVKLPRGGHLRRVVSKHSVYTRFVKDTGFDVPLTYAIITVRRQRERSVAVDQGYQYERPRYDSPPRSPRYERPQSPDYVSRDYPPDSPDYVSRDESPPRTPFIGFKYIPPKPPMYDYSKELEEL